MAAKVKENNVAPIHIDTQTAKSHKVYDEVSSSRVIMC